MFDLRSRIFVVRGQILRLLHLIILILLPVLLPAQEKPLLLRSGEITAYISPGGIKSVQETNGINYNWPVKIHSSLQGCEAIDEVVYTEVPGGGMEYTMKLRNPDNGLSAIFTERFRPAGNSLRCEIEISGTGGPWTTAISTSVKYAVSGSTRIWAPWGDPRISNECMADSSQDETGAIPAGQNWADPLMPRSFFNDTLFYGAPYFRYEKPGIAFIPFQWDLLCIPMVSILEEEDDKGISVILNPDDDILDLTMQVSPDGTIIFNRLFNRISNKKILKFSFDIVTHEADWRGGLRWMSLSYPLYFNPANPAADKMAGTGGYSDSDVDFDVEKMKKMAFRVNWRASFDFPYMGMFIPPVEPGETWMRYGGRPTSVASMQNYAEKMKNLGFHVLSYFNVTEFGAKMNYPLNPVTITKETDLWKSANDFLAVKLQGAVLRVPEGVPQEKLGFYSKTRQGGAYFTWEDGLVTDCGEPVYKDFLLDQAERHIRLIPSSDGICIDRLDWLRMYNEERDDSISWYIDRPARSLITSWKNLMKDLGPLMHENNKVIFVNNHDKRIDLLKNTDGIFDEFTYAGVPLNLTAFLCINKPALGWTSDNGPLRSEGSDNFFQKYLYMGVYPMAPFPGNDHSIRPDDWTDSQYLDYGPLLALMRGKKWVLEPHCIEITEGKAKANLFRVCGGYVLPVVFGGSSETVKVTIRNVPGLSGSECEALYPGTNSTRPLKTEEKSGYLHLEIPLVRGCAMVIIKNVKY